MIAACIIEGILHKVKIFRYSNMRKRVARIHNLKGIPISVLKETEQDNTFFDDINSRFYKLNPVAGVLVSI